MTRALRVLAALAGSLALFGTVVATHIPTPSAFGESEADPGRIAARRVWSDLRRVGAALPDLPDWFDPLRSDKTLHVLLYLLPAALWALSLGRRLPRNAGRLLLAFAAWGALDELSQAWAGRDGEVGDWLANVAGTVLGMGLAWPVAHVVSRLGDRLRTAAARER